MELSCALGITEVLEELQNPTRVYEFGEFSPRSLIHYFRSIPDFVLQKDPTLFAHKTDSVSVASRDNIEGKGREGHAEKNGSRPDRCDFASEEFPNSFQKIL